MKTVLVVGASGVVGRSAAMRLARAKDTRVLRTSRSLKPDDDAGSWLQLDANDRHSCEAALSRARNVTHLVYCALADNVEPSTATEEKVNLTMLRNILEPLAGCAPGFAHVCVVHGGKAYGVQFGQPKLPFKESDPRYPESNFYYPQEDYLRQASVNARWKWTILRPPMICGFVAGSPMNALGVIGAFASISRELGMPLRFPGGQPTMLEAVDVDLVAESIEWCGDEARSANQVFNVSNGDCFAWRSLWPRIADLFSVPVGPDYEVPLARVMADKEDVWQQVVQKYSLRPFRLKEIVPSWHFADFIFRNGNRAGTTLMSTIKIRRAGFSRCHDTEDMFIDRLRELQEAKIFPH